MAGETVTYYTNEALRADCSCGVLGSSWHTSKEGLDQTVIGHLTVVHGWTMEDAQAYVATKVWTPPNVTNP